MGSLKRTIWQLWAAKVWHVAVKYQRVQAALGEGRRQRLKTTVISSQAAVLAHHLKPFSGLSYEITYY